MNDGGDAFPRPTVFGPRSHEDNEPGSCGMTLRDYFAGQALGGLLAEPSATTVEATPGSSCEEVASSYAVLAYAYADAMLQEREKARVP